MEEARKKELLASLISQLEAERGHESGIRDAQASVLTADDLWSVFRALVNTRPPEPASDSFLAQQDELLSGLIAEAGVTTIADAEPSALDERMLLWRGDITTLAVDGIVNAANSQMLGCWVPGHHCIDNAIHTYAGVQLRIECNRIMTEQGHEEPTGSAKITPAYNLPARCVLHTVGPIAGGSPTAEQGVQLANCYLSCLELAESEGLESVAFCCISTGVFGFPQREAAQIAVEAVGEFLRTGTGGPRVVFNVFGDADEEIYRQLLGMRSGKPGRIG